MPHALHVIGGYRLHKLEDIQNQNHPEVGHTHKESTETKKLEIHPSKNCPGPFLWYLGVWDTYKSLGSDFCAGNWKFMWKPYTVIVSYLMRQKILLFIFQTLFRQNCQFFDNFDQNKFLDQTCKCFNKNCPKYYFKLIFSQFLLIPLHHLTKNQF